MPYCTSPGLLDGIYEYEPIYVLRAKNPHAAKALQYYADQCAAHGDDEEARRAMLTVRGMETWFAPLTGAPPRPAATPAPTTGPLPAPIPPYGGL